MYTMKRYNKRPLTHSQIINMLKQRGLSFTDENDAFKILSNISYFRIARYLRPMETCCDLHLFKPNSTFENALELYNFDKKLRHILFCYIGDLEVAIRAKLIQHISLWKTLEVISFSTLSKLYCNLKDVSLKKKIAREFGLPQHLYLESWVKSLTVLRNRIAHYSCVWNRKYPWKPKIPKRLTNLWLANTSIRTEKLYAQLCCLLYMANVICPDNTLRNQLVSLFIQYSNVDLRAMGFPADWHTEPLWRDAADTE